MNPSLEQPSLTAIGNLLAALHIGEGLRRDRIRDSLNLERISFALCTFRERQNGPAAFPHLSESILATCNQVWPLPDARAACATAFQLFDLLSNQGDTPEAVRLLRISHSLLRSAMRRLVNDRRAGIPV